MIRNTFFGQYLYQTLVKDNARGASKRVLNNIYIGDLLPADFWQKIW